MGSTATLPGKAPDVGSAAENLGLRVVRTIAEVEELRERWEAWQDHPGSVIDTYLAWFKEHPGSRPHVLVLYRNGHPDCLLVGKLLRKSLTSSVARLFRSHACILYFIQGGLLGNASPENCEFLVRAVLDQLRAGEGSAAEFFGLPVDSPLYRATMEIPNFFCRDHFPAKMIHRYLLLPDSFRDFLGSLPAKERHNITYRHKRLMKHFPGKVRLRRFWEEEDVESLIAAAEEIAARAYQRALGRGFTLADAAGLRSEARAGSLRGYVLYIDEKPAAFLMARWHRALLYGTFAAHDPEFAEYSPGRYLLLCCIEDSFLRTRGERTLIIDPGQGDQSYKRLFTNSERIDADLLLYPPTLGGFLGNAATLAVSYGSHCVKRVLAKTKLFPLVRKIHRHRAVRKMRRAHAPTRS